VIPFWCTSEDSDRCARWRRVDAEMTRVPAQLTGHVPGTDDRDSGATGALLAADSCPKAAEGMTMSTRLTKDAFKALVDQDLQWLKSMPSSLERQHILMILLDAVEHYYPDAPDIRPASELTPEKLKAWQWWTIVGQFGTDTRSDLSIIDDSDPDGPALHDGGFERWYLDRVRVYPCHDGKPWRPASWPEVDQAIHAAEASKREEDTTGECLSCSDAREEEVCPKSKRACKHHCNHSWSHDECCWCGQTWDE